MKMKAGPFKQRKRIYQERILEALKQGEATREVLARRIGVGVRSIGQPHVQVSAAMNALIRGGQVTLRKKRFGTFVYSLAENKEPPRVLSATPVNDALRGLLLALKSEAQKQAKEEIEILKSQIETQAETIKGYEEKCRELEANRITNLDDLLNFKA